MSSNLVIVALPADDDRVWKVSSEKKPHLTLLFLGDAENNPNVGQIMQFVQHATTMSEHGPFYLDVDRRGELGEDKADVVFFSKRSWNLKWIKQFRGQLLQNGAIKTAYDSVDQFPEWNPHLTLGYPETPAKPLDQDGFDHPLYSVSFDRIAVWTGDFEGPEFRLEWPEREFDEDSPMALAYSAAGKEAVDGIIEHYGVKGMRWGVRKEDRPAETKKGWLDPEGQDLNTDIVKSVLWPMVPPLGLFAIPAQVRLTRAGARATKAKIVDIDEKKFEANASSQKTFVEIHNRSSDRFNREIGGINAKHPGDLTKDAKKQKAYDADVQKLLQDSYREAANSIGNRSKTMHLDLEFKNDGLDFSIKAKQGQAVPLTKRVQHAADEDMLEFEVELTFDGKIQRAPTGHILGLDFTGIEQTAPVKHTADLGADFLEHFGVKGMKWGVRKVKAGFKAVGRGLSSMGAALAESHWQSSVYSDFTHERVHNNVAHELDNHIEKLQRSPKYRGKNLKADTELRKTYYQDVAKVTESAYKRSVKETLGENPSGDQKAHYVTDARGPRIEVRSKKTGEVTAESPLSSLRDIQRRRDADGLETTPTSTNGSTPGVTRGDPLRARHAATGEAPDLEISLKLDDNGQISGVGFIKPSEEELAQSADRTANSGAMFIEHYGIKGMRWGVRKSEPVAVTPTATSTVPHGTKRKTKIKAEGGENHPATEDAIKVAEARIKLHKSGPAALTNQELREVATRMQLESQVTQMTRPAASKFIRDILGQQGKQGANQFVRTQVDKTVKKR